MERQAQADAYLQLQIIVDLLLEMLRQGIQCPVKRFGVAVRAAGQRNHSLVDDDRGQPPSRRNQLLDHVMGGEQQQMKILFLIAAFGREVDAKRNHGHGAPLFD
ncbi:hypothetical protein D3C73_1327520 [compost metagenome]